MNELALKALREFEAQNGKLDVNDTVYIWHWVDDDEIEHIKINTINHAPEGVAIEAGSLKTIEDWWESTWDCAY